MARVPRTGSIPDSTSDEVLIQDAARGQHRAFEVIVQRYQDKVYQFAKWFLGERDQIAEDVTQEVFLQAFRSAKSFRRQAKFRTWLYSVARNVCCHHLRKHPDRRWFATDSEVVQETLQGIPDERPDPLTSMEKADMQRAVRQAVLRLPAHHQTVLMLRDWEGLSYREIAGVLRIPSGTVRSRLHNARAALAGSLASTFRSNEDGLQAS